MVKIIVFSVVLGLVVVITSAYFLKLYFKSKETQSNRRLKKYYTIKLCQIRSIEEMVDLGYILKEVYSWGERWEKLHPNDATAVVVFLDDKRKVFAIKTPVQKRSN